MNEIKPFDFEQEKIVVLDKRDNRIFLSTKNDDHIVLSSFELFSILVNKSNVHGIPFVNLKIDSEILILRVIKSQHDLSFNLNIKSQFTSVACSLVSASRKIDLTISEVLYAQLNGYLIKNSELISVSMSSCLISRELVSQLDSKGNLSIANSIKLYAKREHFSLINFSNKQINYTEIFKNKAYTGSTSHFKHELYDYQKDGLKWLQYCFMNRIGGLLGDDMGLGKTAQVIAWTAWIQENNLIDNILIVVPSTLIENWKREFYFFAPKLTPHIHHGPSRGGSVNLFRNSKIVLTSYSMIINDFYLFNKIKWGVLIADEASLIKNPYSERKLFLSQIDAEIKIAMTGTPIENSLIDLWSICDFISPGYLGSLETFSNKYIKQSIDQTIHDNSYTDLKDTISFIMLRRKKEDVLDSLPEKIDIHQALCMNENESILYNTQRELILTKIHSENRKSILNQIQNLRQYTTHPLLLEPDKIRNANLKDFIAGSTKFKRTVEIISEIKLRNEKVLIFTEYLDMIDAFQRVLEELYSLKIETIDGRIPVNERQLAIDTFSRKIGFAIMVLNPKTAGMGLNITAANHVIHYTRQWNPALEEQATARAYRNKQERNVNVYYLYYVNTIEEYIDNRLRAKVNLSNEIIETTVYELSFDEYLTTLSKNPKATKI